MPLIYPGATYDPLGPQTEPAAKAHDILCFHTMAGVFATVDAEFHKSGYSGLESHFGVRADGFTKQWQDLWFEADANLYGNPNCVSIETEDVGPAFPQWFPDASKVPPWTAQQLGSLIALALWYTDKSTHASCPAAWRCRAEGIPRVVIPDTLPGRRGIGYHRQGINGNYPDHDGLVAGGVRWSDATGKTCPGYARAAQLRTIIVPALQALDAGGVMQLWTSLYDETQALAAACNPPRPDLVTAVWPAGTVGPPAGTAGALVTVNDERFHTLIVLAAKALTDRPSSTSPIDTAAVIAAAVQASVAAVVDRLSNG